jgi:hypothetical protein
MNINDPDFKPRIDEELRVFLPELTSDELELLTQNCKNDPQHELLPPVQVCPEMMYAIIDGHHQYAIRKKLKLAIRYVEVSMPGGIPDAVAYMVQLQLGRRNLSPSQRSSILAKAARHYSYGGDRKSSNQATAGGKTLDEMAAMAGVSKRTQSAATKVVDNGAAPVAEGVIAGKFTVSDAANVVELPKEVQEEIVEQATANGQTLTKTKRTLEARSRSGQEIVNSRVRKETLATLGHLWRLLRKLGIQAECEDHMEAVEDLIRNAAALVEEKNKVPF